MTRALSRLLGHRFLTSALCIPGLLLAVPAPASSGRLLGIRTGHHGDSLRVVLDLEGKVACSIRPTEESDDWVVVLNGLCPANPPARIPDPHPFLRAIDASCAGRDLEVRLLANRPLRVKTFLLPASAGSPMRYVVDLRAGERRTGTPARESPAVPEPLPRRRGDWRILIDPGHGGDDPGATRSDLKEKEIVLDVAQRVAKILDDTPGFEARLSRTTDVRLGLRQRRRIAEEYEADAFISVHVNAVRPGRVKGVEVYFLSLGGASDEASRELARLENEADPDYVLEEDSLLQGIPFGFDLRQSDTIRRSSRLAEAALEALERSGLAASRGVKQAGFAVLKSFQVPSVLVEIGFLSNPDEAKRLKSPSHRERLAACIASGAIAYFQHSGRARAEEPGDGD